MKKIINKKEIIAFTKDDPRWGPDLEPIDFVEFPHDSLVLEEIAGIEINRMLKFRKIKTTDYESYVLELRNPNPEKASLSIASNVSRLMLDSSIDTAKEIEKETIKNMVNELFSKMMEAVDRVHNFKKDF